MHELNDLARDLYLSKQQSEPLSSRLKQLNLVQEDVRMTIFRNWNKKVIALFMGMQAGFTKYCCFLCLWDSRAVSQHYKQKDWGSRSTFVPGEHSLKENPLVDMNKVLLPPLHIRLGLMKNFGAAFQHLSSVFQVLVLLSSKRASLSNLRSEKCWRIPILRSFLNESMRNIQVIL